VSGFGKSFAAKYGGSMFGQPLAVWAVWDYCITCQRPRRSDGECTVELNVALLAATFGASPEQIRSAIEYLCAPDENSRTETEDGRRLVLEHGTSAGLATYRVVNGAVYRAVRDEDTRREQVRLAVKKHRGNQRNQSKPRKAQAEADTESEAEAERAGAREATAAAEDFPEIQTETVEPEDVSRAWHARLEAPGGCPGQMHAFHAWKRDYETVAGAINRLPAEARRTALRALLAWFWTAEEGPVCAGRVKRTNASPAMLAKHIGRDLVSANDWWMSRDEAAE
jgi:hypothetical protein